MEDKNLQALKDIQQMMAKSSRFISLSGLSGIAAGICALIGAFFANQIIRPYYNRYSVNSVPIELRNELILIGLTVFIIALVSAFLFTLQVCLTFMR